MVIKFKKMGLFRGFLVVAFFAILGAACKPQPTFPTTPALTFKEFIQPAGSDSLRVVFSFTDGDGDIGLLQSDTDSNMVLTVYAPDATGNFIVMDNLTTPQIDSLFYMYRVPRLTAGQSGLEGDIYLTIQNKWFIGRDTLQFNAFLLDNSNNRSNYVRTSTVILTH